MSPARILRLASREFRAGPRSPLFLLVVFVPLMITFLMRTVLLAVLDPEPRLAVVDLGASALPALVETLPGLHVLAARDGAVLEDLLARGGADAGLLLPAGFDEALRGGTRPLLDLRFPPQGVRAEGLLAALAVTGPLREIAGDPGMVTVTVESPEGGEVLSDRLLPAVVLFVMIVAGILTPAFLLVQEKERRTLQALLVTPARVSEVILAKALVGAVLTVATSLLTLGLNGVHPAHPGAMLAVLAAGTWICVGIGMLYGCTAPDARTLYTLLKSLNILIAAPVLFYIFPDWPRWIARLFPTWWFLDPLYRVALHGADLPSVAGPLAVAAGVGLLLTLAAVPLGRRMARRIAGA